MLSVNRVHFIVLSLLFMIACEGDKVLIDDKGKVNAMVSPNALAFDNLSSMANLQSQTNPKSLFFSLSGGVGLDGRVANGEDWSFHYYESQKYFDDWYVFKDGSIEHGTHTPERPFQLPGSFLPHLRINSDRIVQICLENGADKYLEKFQPQQIYVEYGYNYILGNDYSARFYDFTNPLCKVQFYHPSCTIKFTIHPESGDLLDTDLSCLSS